MGHRVEFEDYYKREWVEVDRLLQPDMVK